MRKKLILIILILSALIVSVFFYNNTRDFNELKATATSYDMEVKDPGIIVMQSEIDSLNNEIIKVEEEIKAKEYEDSLITLVAVGDVLIHSNIYKEAKTNEGYDFNYLFTEVKPIIEEADLAFANIETPITGNVYEVSNYPLFSTPVEILDALLNAGFNMFNTASNHSLDMGAEGIDVVIDNYENYQETNEFIYSGVNNSKEMQYDIPVIEVNGTTISLIGFTTVTNGFSLPESNPYAVNYYSEELANDLITEAKKVSDVQIVSMHWGEEGDTTPSEEQQQIASYLSSLGVDIILGHHPHVIQPTEMVGDCLVIYSMGNFVAGQDEALNQSSGIYTINFRYNEEEDKIDIESYSITPTFSYNNCWSDGVYTDITTGCGYNNKVITEDIEQYNPAYEEAIAIMEQDPNIIINE